MRKLAAGLVGIALAVGLIGQPRLSEAVDSCAANGAYDLNGFAAGETELFGLLVFTPSGACTSGTFTGSVTIKSGAGPAFTVAPSGTYTVDGDSTLTITAPGLVTLKGRVSQLANDVANAIHTAGDVAGTINVAVTMTRSALTGAVTVLNRSANLFSVVNSATPTNVYTFPVPAGTLSGGKLLRGRLLYDYTNNTGSPKNLTIALTFGATTVATQTLTNLGAGFALGELEFVIGDTITSLFQNGGFRGVHGDSGGPIALIAVGTAGENLGIAQSLQLRVTHSVASLDLVIRKLSVVLELL